jgi:hypothetical protein
MGQTLRRNDRTGRAGWRPAAGWLTQSWLAAALLLAALVPGARARAQAAGLRLDEGRFTLVAERQDERLARALLSAARARDSFPGLPRPSAHVLIAIAPDAERFRAWVGPGAPEWGAAIAFPDQQRIVMQGGRAGSDAGDPAVVLRHELAHLALHESMGRLPSRWFDEGYASVAAGEWTREQSLETSVGMIWRTLPTVDSLESGFYRGAGEATWSYALAHRAVAELEALDKANGLGNLFRYWKETGAFEPAIRLAYGLTSDQFNRHWHDITRRRYGALALLSNVSLAVGIFGVLLGPLFIARRRRDRRRLEAMRTLEAAQDKAARESALEALLATGIDASRTVPEP